METIVTHSVRVRATPEEVWKKLSDAPTWADWDTGMEWAEVPGPFVAGARGRFKPVGSLVAVPLEIVRVDPTCGYVSEARVATLKLRFAHWFEVAGDEVVVTFSIAVQGLGTGLFRWLRSPALRRDLPTWMEQLKADLERLARALSDGVPELRI
jgi:hypothetical protein